MIGLALGVLLVACLPQLLSYLSLALLIVALLLCLLPVTGRWLALGIRLQVAGFYSDVYLHQAGAISI